MKSAEIREAFLAFFERNGHQRVDSSSLVPGNDPTLLFTNAGMVQFKDVFLGSDKREYSRAVSSQRCVRAGGKHNDLENVGYTARHHTFFEMLGNFSFGDYFKRDAIRFAWQFLTEELGLPANKLWVTVYKEDKEAEDIWFQDIGIDPQRFSRLGEKDNFWSMGDTGPCGPCSEIFYDHGADVFGGPPGSPDEDGDRYIEIWNLVFMQFNRSADGRMTDLPKPSVDTGMGLERVAAVMQGVHNNYEIDLFQTLLKSTAKLCGLSELSDNSLKVIADHIRSCAFMVVDGVVPSNEGRGYVLRRIIRRAIRHGNKLGVKGAFFHKLVAPLVAEMGEAYPDLRAQSSRVEKTLLAEEVQFAKTLEQGMKILEQDLEHLEGIVISGATAFKLYDTYGFPVDLTADIARERDLSVDMPGFEECMSQQRARARSAGQFSVDYGAAVELEGSTEFVGYDLVQQAVHVQTLFNSDASSQTQTEELQQGAQGVVMLERTPFYAESGGQAGDSGELRGENSHFRVLNTVKLGAHHAHHGTVVKGCLKVGDSLQATVDEAVRKATALNHTATHLMHAALRAELGEHVQQKGSLVDADKLRFDFSHHQAVSHESLARVEDVVNAQIRANSEVQTELMAIDEAMEKGAMALFGEKYGEEVRVLSMGKAGEAGESYSVELCGGTHASRTGDIGIFRISSESGISAGVRRIEALTGQRAFETLRRSENNLHSAAGLLKADGQKLVERLQQLLNVQKQAEKELGQLKMKLASAAGSDLMSQAVKVGEVSVLAIELPNADSKALRDTMDQLKNKLGSAVILLASQQGEKVALVSGVTKDLTDTLSAGELMKLTAQQLGGKGGGRADMAQGAGNDASALPAALTAVPNWVKEKILR